MDRADHWMVLDVLHDILLLSVFHFVFDYAQVLHTDFGLVPITNFSLNINNLSNL
jgi:hypothetical protein